MRNLAQIIDQIIEVSTIQNLNTQLEKIKKDISFTAPENIHLRWTQTYAVLESFIPEPTDDETVKIVSIFSGQPESDIRHRYKVY